MIKDGADNVQAVGAGRHEVVRMEATTDVVALICVVTEHAVARDVVVLEDVNISVVVDECIVTAADYRSWYKVSVVALNRRGVATSREHADEILCGELPARPEGAVFDA